LGGAEMKRTHGSSSLRFSMVFMILGLLLVVGGGLVQLRHMGLSVWQVEASVVPVKGNMPVAIGWQAHITELIPTALVLGEWPLLTEKGHYLVDSARLNEKGNVIVYGHNTPTVLGWLLRVKVGEVIQLFGQDEQVYSYKVASIQDVEADDVSWLRPTDTSVITIYTCSGWFDQHRRVVRAVKID